MVKSMFLSGLYVISQATYVVLFACSSLISIDSNFNEIDKNIVQLFRAISFNNNFRGSENYTRNACTLQLSYTVEKGYSFQNCI